MDKAKEILKKNTMIIALIVVTIFFTITTNGTLLVPQNVTNLIAQNGYVVILAVGMLICILTGGNIDLSVGSIVCLIGSIAGTLIVNKHMNNWVAIIICLAIGIVIGVIQGYWIAYLRIPAFIVTLAGMLLWRGVALIVLDGLTVSPFPDDYLNLFNSYVPDVFNGNINILAIVLGFVVCIVYVLTQSFSRINRKKKGYQLNSILSDASQTVIICVVVMALAFSLSNHKGVPMILILLAVIVFVYTYFTTKTVPGRYLYAMGGNEKAAKLSGINTNRVLFFAYVNMAFLSAVAALVCVARFNSAAPTAGANYEMDAIGSCYIGGASAYGGIGSVPRVVIGAIFMGVINNGMSMMGIDSNIQKVVKGVVLLAAVTFDVLSKKRGRLA
ncbi:MAG: putative rane protein [Herbinix sp.]|jgi:putative multiple sugar transport system permease protein|nr:putative rane protein [Herbinix sp.]